MEIVRTNIMFKDEVMFNNPTDLLDAYCYDQFGHYDWYQQSCPDGNIIIVFKRKGEKVDE